MNLPIIHVTMGHISKMPQHGAQIYRGRPS
jgi:hypothetical protein